MNQAETASGLEITDRSGRRLVDLAAARCSSLGHGDRDLLAALTAALPSIGMPQPVIGTEWADGAGQPQATESWSDWGEPFAAFGGGTLVASASAANDAAIRLARQLGSLLPGATTPRYRIITVLGSDHGDTLACRSASGLVEAQTGLSPLLPGFRHVAAGDVAAIEKAIDSETVAVMLSPVDWGRGGVPLPADYLAAVRQLCNQQGLLLIIDETRLPAAISGQWFFHAHAAIPADILTVSAGWTGGLPGGLVLVSSAVQSLQTQLTAPAALPPSDYALLRVAFQTTAAKIQATGGPQQIEPLMAQADSLWQELVDGFEFVSGVHTAGLWSVVELDVPAKLVRQAAERQGMSWPVSGETTLIACLPLPIATTGSTEPSFFQQLLQPLRETLETIERQTIESS